MDKMLQNWKIRKKDKYYYRGEWSGEIFSNSIAVVGSRRMTRYGKEVIDKFVTEFVAGGITTISGFMYGVDTQVHQKTVDYDGKTIAVFGCGLDHIYPPENEKLYLRILEKGGLVISEYEKNAKPHLWKFPQRNKVVARLAKLGILVIEAGEKSGSLVTAELGRKIGKKIYAVPGPINSSVSAGCNWLIKTGKAIMVTEPGDILGSSVKKTEDNELANVKLSDLEKNIINLLKNESMGVDEIAINLGISIVEVGAAISLMTLKGLIEESGGKYYKN